MSDPNVSDHEEVEENASASAEESPASPKKAAASEEAAEAASEEAAAGDEASGEADSEEPGKKGWAAAALTRDPRAGSGFLGKRTATQSGKQEVSPVDEEEAAEKDIADADLSLDDKILFYKERECLLLLLEARKLLCSMITRREAVTQRLLEEKRLLEEEERKRGGRLSVQEIQNMLQNSADEDDYDMVSGESPLSLSPGAPAVSLCISRAPALVVYFPASLAPLTTRRRDPGAEEEACHCRPPEPQAGARFGEARQAYCAAHQEQDVASGCDRRLQGPQESEEERRARPDGGQAAGGSRFSLLQLSLPLC